MSLSAVIVNAVSLRSLRRTLNIGKPEPVPEPVPIIKELRTEKEAPSREDRKETKVDKPHAPIKETHACKSHRRTSEGTARSRKSKEQTSRKRKCSGVSPQEASPCHTIVEQILHKVNELEYTLYEDQQQEFKLRMALERQTERVHDLRFSLEAEKQRNQRLVQLIRATDTAAASNSDEEEQPEPMCALVKWQPTLDSISPLLMQQRYDELSATYKQARRQLAKKDKRLTMAKCDKEELQAKYDYLFDEYRNEQKRLEDICGKYLTLQFRKKQEILNLREALDYASDCIISAQNLLERCEQNYDKRTDREFQQNLQYFIKALRRCCPSLYQQQTLSSSGDELSASN